MGVTYTTAAANTYVPIATTTVTGSTISSYTFSSIAGTYTDLVLICSAKDTFTSTFAGMNIRFNGDSATNYSNTQLYGDGSAAYSDRTSSAAQLSIGNISTTANIFSTHIVNIMNYANATTNKTVLVRNGQGTRSAANNSISAFVGLWRATPAAITSITLYPQTAFDIGSTFSLYGIKGA
jgi:hypothetical protein